jgi:hypothetical protein
MRAVRGSGRTVTAAGRVGAGIAAGALAVLTAAAAGIGIDASTSAAALASVTFQSGGAPAAGRPPAQMGDLARIGTGSSRSGDLSAGATWG